MDFSRQRESNIVEENDLIIKSNQHYTKKIICTMTTFFISIYSIVIVYFFLSALFNIDSQFIDIIKLALKVTNYEIIQFIEIIMMIFIVLFLFLFCWKTYNNKKVSGKLDRSLNPGITSDKEMLNLNLVDLKTYKILQNEKVIVFEKNPIKELAKGGIN